VLTEIETVIDQWAIDGQSQTEQTLRMSELLDQIAANNRDKSKGGSSLLSVFALDPFAGLDPTARALADLRLTADRGLYLSERLPLLMRWQANILTAEQALSPTGAQLLGDVHALATLPAQLSAERQAITADLLQHEARLTALVASVRGALDSTRSAAEALTGTLTAFNQVVDRFDRPSEPGEPNRPPARPFDITEYERTVNAVAGAMDNINTALGTAESVAGSDVLTQRIDQFEATTNRLILRLAAACAGLIVLAAGAWLAVRRLGRR
jgi:hypothetical protein